jgi:hypothetical protein
LNLVSKAISWTAGALAAVVGGLVGLAVIVALVTQSPATGIKASVTLAHYGVVMAGGVLSYADNVGPDLAEGQSLGDKALNEKKAQS